MGRRRYIVCGLKPHADVSMVMACDIAVTIRAVRGVVVSYMSRISSLSEWRLPHSELEDGTRYSSLMSVMVRTSRMRADAGIFVYAAPEVAADNSLCLS